jgi:hypothetical protein
MKRLSIRLRALAFASLALVAVSCSKPAAAGPVITMYKTPTCGCCGAWADHMRENGFTVQEVIRADLNPIRKEMGVPGNMLSCHTAVIDGYAVEGHVPADVVARLLRERPAVAGIAVPGMPIGSPGMEQLGRWEPYEVYTFSNGAPKAIYEVRNGPSR